MNGIWERVLANSFSGIHKSKIICSALDVSGGGGAGGFFVILMGCHLVRIVTYLSASKAKNNSICS